MTDVVIIGAGISGLSCGHFISKKTNNFLILAKKSSISKIKFFHYILLSLINCSISKPFLKESKSS